MRRLICMLLSILMLMTLLPAFAESELQPVYRAKMTKETKMRAEPSTKARYICTMPRDAVIVIYEYGEEWSLCGYNGKTGYLLTNRI